MYSDLTGTMKGVKSTSKREIFPIFLLLFPNPRTTFFFQYIQFFHFQKYCFVRCQNMENSVDSDVSGIKSFGYFCDKDFKRHRESASHHPYCFVLVMMMRPGRRRVVWSALRPWGSRVARAWTQWFNIIDHIFDTITTFAVESGSAGSLPSRSIQALTPPWHRPPSYPGSRTNLRVIFWLRFCLVLEWQYSKLGGKGNLGGHEKMQWSNCRYDLQLWDIFGEGKAWIYNPVQLVKTDNESNADLIQREQRG